VCDEFPSRHGLPYQTIGEKGLKSRRRAWLPGTGASAALVPAELVHRPICQQAGSAPPQMPAMPMRQRHPRPKPIADWPALAGAADSADPSPCG